MPKLQNATLSTLQTRSNYRFSGTRVDDLTDASEYSLVSIICDASSSVSQFQTDNLIKRVE